MLQTAAKAPFSDWFHFAVGPPVMDLTAAPYGGARYPIEARMDDRIFARFHLDVDVGDVVVEPLETILCPNWLGFAGIESSRVLAVARERNVDETSALEAFIREEKVLRVGEPEDIAALVAFVLSPHGRYIHGSLIDADGGSTKTV